MNNNNFTSWLIKDKFTIILTLICAIAPFAISHIEKLNKTPSLGWDFYSDLFSMVLIIIVLCWILLKSKFIKDKQYQKQALLHDYVVDEFGSHSELGNEEVDSLFERMRMTLKQFYYGWVAVWIIWLIMYTEKFIHYFYVNFGDNCMVDSIMMERLNYFFANFMNLFNSCAMFFIYMVITISTVNHKKSSNRGQMYEGIIVLCFILFVCSIIEIFSMYYCQNLYDVVQFCLQLLIGIFASISFMSVLGRLNSNYLNMSQWVVMCLYFYSAIQIIYPLTYNNILDRIFVSYSLDFIKILSVLAFLGKVFLFIIIRWIMLDNRFLCFVLHKANAMSESDRILSDFNFKYKSH
jgi:hypothetical protein